MNIIVILAALTTGALAGPLYHVSVSQDTLGNYHFDYKTADASRTEHANAQNEVNGQYSFIDKEGHHHHIQYTAGVDGFKPVGDSIPQLLAPMTNIDFAPVPIIIQYDPEVQEQPAHIVHAPHEHVHQLAPAHVPHQQTEEPVVIVNGVPQDTQEVAAAKKQILSAHKEIIDTLIH